MRFDILFYDSFDPEDYIEVRLNSELIGDYKKESRNGFKICSDHKNYWDFLMFFNKNLTSHNSTWVTVSMKTITD